MSPEALERISNASGGRGRGEGGEEINDEGRASDSRMLGMIRSPKRRRWLRILMSRCARGGPTSEAQREKEGIVEDGLMRRVGWLQDTKLERILCK